MRAAYIAWQDSLYHKGAHGHWLPAPEAIANKVGRSLLGLDDFYTPGQWCYRRGDSSGTL